MIAVVIILSTSSWLPLLPLITKNCSWIPTQMIGHQPTSLQHPHNTTIPHLHLHTLPHLHCYFAKQSMKHHLSMFHFRCPPQKDPIFWVVLHHHVWKVVNNKNWRVFGELAKQPTKTKIVETKKKSLLIPIQNLRLIL